MLQGTKVATVLRYHVTKVSVKNKVLVTRLTAS